MTNDGKHRRKDKQSTKNAKEMIDSYLVRNISGISF